jgi:hypothetical protein
MAKRGNFDDKPTWHIIVCRADGSEYIVESYPDEERAHERACLLAGRLEGIIQIRVSRDHAAKTHGRA